MSIYSRVDRLEAGQQVIVVDFDDYAAAFAVIAAIPDEETRHAHYRQQIRQIAEESGETGKGEITIWTGVDSGGRWVIYHDTDRQVIRNYRTASYLTWQEAIRQQPISSLEGMDALQAELKRRTEQQ